MSKELPNPAERLATDLAHAAATSPRVIVELAGIPVGGAMGWVEFVTANGDAFERAEFERIRALVERGEVFRGGGGAAPTFTVRAASALDAQWEQHGCAVYTRDEWRAGTNFGGRFLLQVFSEEARDLFPEIDRRAKLVPEAVAEQVARRIAAMPRLLAATRGLLELCRQKGIDSGLGAMLEASNAVIEAEASN